MIKFNQNAWLKSYIDMNIDLKKTKNVFERFFEVDESCNFWKSYGKCEKT